MVVEYMMILLMSAVILIGSFGLGINDSGPVGMFNDKAPYLAKSVEYNLETGIGFKPYR